MGRRKGMRRDDEREHTCGSSKGNARSPVKQHPFLCCALDVPTAFSMVEMMGWKGSSKKCESLPNAPGLHFHNQNRWGFFRSSSIYGGIKRFIRILNIRRMSFLFGKISIKKFLFRWWSQDASNYQVLFNNLLLENRASDPPPSKKNPRVFYNEICRI